MNGANLLRRVVLDLKFYTCWLAGYHETAKYFALHPDLAILSDDNTFRTDPVELVELFYDIHLSLVGDELLLALPEHADGRADLVADLGEARSEGDRGGAGGGDGDAEGEGGDAAARLVVVVGVLGIAWSGEGLYGIGGG